ncbi:hypothetical protein BTJ68_03947 [Hortaea werneckii EXF-2000]|uniref:Uncharacterized protein n=1 Tax=Hortaea werneckii EXF-2000 TaxID=1157616 RepID=A0A1Z5TKH1_HORWE|nr:hypothetical protein BTJ68_03947 [Hortaea werneckii EXF-2000]
MSLLRGALLLACSTAALAHNGHGNHGHDDSPFPPFSGNPFEKVHLSAKGINASFIPYGARLTQPFRQGQRRRLPRCRNWIRRWRAVLERHIDRPHFLRCHPLAAMPTASRIVPFEIDGETSNIVANEHDGLNTLHGGEIGYEPGKLGYDVVIQNYVL